MRGETHLTLLPSLETNVMHPDPDFIVADTSAVLEKATLVRNQAGQKFNHYSLHRVKVKDG